MLRLRKQQLEALHVGPKERFAADLAGYVRTNFPEKTDGIRDDDLQRLIATGIARAEGYNMSSQSALAAFVVLTFAAAPDFDQHPRIEQILTDERFQPDHRIDLFQVYMTEGDWHEITSQVDGDAWRRWADASRDSH